MSENKIKKLIADSFNEIAAGIESGSFGKKIKVGLTIMGSEHGEANLIAGAEMAAKDGIDVVLIGPKSESKLEQAEANTEEECHKVMEKLLDSGEIDAAVTSHYTFPIGTSTVGRVITPGRGKEMFLATTTGTSAAHKSAAMVKNAIYGIITAKSMGIENPSLGILNLDGARQVEIALKEIDANGYKINFADSLRADGGVVMRGNDLLAAACDVMVMDTLTGNIMMKVTSSYTTGGSYEAMGYGYGPGVSGDMERTILILSRASGMPVVANAIRYAAAISKGEIKKIAKEEYAKAKKAGLEDILNGLTAKSAGSAPKAPTKMPDKEVVTEQISGIDIMDLDDAVAALLNAGIYAESGMGCTGPIALVSPANREKAETVLRENKYII